MFDRLHVAQIYAKALKAIRTGRFDNRKTYVHDYDAKCYREDKDYTLNGLHWGYPDGITKAITGMDPQGASCIDYATWVTPKTRAQCSGNSRFSIVLFKEIRAIIEKGIEQKLQQASTESKVEARALARWRKALPKRFPKWLDVVMRLEVSEPNTLDIIAIDPTRFVTRGFGDFLEDIKKGEVSMSPAARDLLLTTPSRQGLNGVEIFVGPIFAGMLRVPELRGVPKSAISADKKGVAQLIALARIED